MNRLPLPQASDLPTPMRELPHWGACKLLQRDGEMIKFPVDPNPGPNQGRGAKSNDPATWATFDVAYAYARRHGYGLAFFLAPPLVGIDLDDCRDPETGALTPVAEAVLGELDTYAEISVSGKGVKAIGYGRKPGTRCRRKGLNLEIYGERRFFALTGQRWQDAPLDVADCQAAIDHIYGAAFGEDEQPQRPSSPPPVTDEDDRAIIDWLHEHRAATFSRLWHGPHGDDPSADDLALCNLLAWRTGDEYRTDRLFRQSALYRDKWDERRGAQTYGQKTVAKAFEGRTSFWESPQRREALPPHVDDSPRLAALEARIGALEVELAKERRLRERAQKTLTSVIQVRRNPHIKAERDTLVATIFDVMAEIADGRADEKGRVKLHTQRIAEATGKSPATVRNHAKVGAESGLWDLQLESGSDPQTGERRTYYQLHPKDDPEKLLDVLVTLDPVRLDKKTGEEKESWGGKRQPCPDCGSTKRRTVVSCEDCGHEFSSTVKDVAEDAPVETVEVSPPPTYPDDPFGESLEETDEWDAYFCNEPNCKRMAIIGKRYCADHDPDRQARMAPHMRPPRPLHEPIFTTGDD